MRATQYDVVNLLTDTSLATASNPIIGVAFVGTACTNGAASISTYRQTVTATGLVMAHEIAHQLGALHDQGAPGAPCARDQFIMSAWVVRASKVIKAFA